MQRCLRGLNAYLPHAPALHVCSYQLLYPQPGVDRKFVWGGACMAFQREPRGAANAGSKSKGHGDKVRTSIQYMHLRAKKCGAR